MIINDRLKQHIMHSLESLVAMNRMAEVYKPDENVPETIVEEKEEDKIAAAATENRTDVNETAGMGGEVEMLTFSNAEYKEEEGDYGQYMPNSYTAGAIDMFAAEPGAPQEGPINPEGRDYDYGLESKQSEVQHLSFGSISVSRPSMSEIDMKTFLLSSDFTLDHSAMMRAHNEITSRLSINPLSGPGVFSPSIDENEPVDYDIELKNEEYYQRDFNRVLSMSSDNTDLIDAPNSQHSEFEMKNEQSEQNTTAVQIELQQQNLGCLGVIQAKIDSYNLPFYFPASLLLLLLCLFVSMVILFIIVLALLISVS